MAVLNFTARTIDGLKSSPKREAYWDDSLPGFGIRITPNGRKTWFYMYRFGGRMRRLTIGAYPALSLANARQMALEAQYAIAQGNDPGHQKQIGRRAETFEELVTEYLERHAKVKKKSWEEDERILQREFLPIWKNCKAKTITRRDVLLALDKIVERGSPILANKALAILRKAFNFAIQRDIVEVNPCWNIPTPGKIKSRDRVLNYGELKTLWKVLESEELLRRSFYQLLLLTGQRSGELGAAEWREVDLNNGWWTIPAERSKNSLPHRVPLAREALKIFKTLRLQAGGSRFVFPSSKGDFPIKERKRGLSTIRTMSGVDFRPHDLRRTAASCMTSIGIARLTVSKILNHTEKSVTAVYDRYSYDGEKRTALELWADHLKLAIETNGIVERVSTAQL